MLHYCCVAFEVNSELARWKRPLARPLTRLLVRLDAFEKKLRVTTNERVLSPRAAA